MKTLPAWPGRLASMSGALLRGGKNWVQYAYNETDRIASLDV